MRFGSRPWRHIFAGGVLILLACAGTLWLITRDQERLQNEELARELVAHARVVSAVLGEQWGDVGTPAVRALVAALASSAIELAVIDPDGRVWLDSGPASAPLGEAALAALRDGSLPAPDLPVTLRRLGPAHLQHLVVAAPVSGAAGTVRGYAWLARREWTIAGQPAAFLRLLSMTGLIAALLSLLLLLLYFRMRRRVLLAVIQAVRNLSSSEWEALPTYGEREQVRLAQALAAVRRQLAAQVDLIDRQRRMLQSLLDQLQEGVIAVRGDGRIVLLNPTAVRLLQLPSRDGTGAAFVNQPLEDCIPQHTLQKLLRGEPDGGADAPREERVEIEGPGGTTHLLARASEVLLAEPGRREGGTPGRVVLLADITQLQRTSQLRSDFVANASHELRTPLATIRAAVETLLTLDLVAEVEAARMFLDKIDRHSARLELMVADLLDLSRIETPAARFEPEEVDIRRLVQDVHGRFAERLERRKLEWSVERVPPHAPTVFVNSHLVRLVLDNLVDNAIKFTEPGGRITLRVVSGPGAMEFAVIDTGCGISEEDQQRVFERFYQVQRARSGPERGTGLGLSIVRHAVSAMGGSVSLRSGLGQGTTVSVRVPQPGSPTPDRLPAAGSALRT